MDLKATVFIATSLDGFIARKNGDLEWLPGSDGSGDGEDYGYQDLWHAIDTLVLGRNTFDMVLGFGQWPYDGKRIVVLSHSQPTIPDEIKASIEVLSGSAQEVAQKLADGGSKHLYIDGGKTIQSFLSAGLIQELIITIVPVLIGEGLPLFGPLENDIHLELLQSNSYASGFVQNRYLVSRPTQAEI